MAVSIGMPITTPLPPSPNFSSSLVGGRIPLAEQILRKTQYLYALVLLLTFVVCVAWYSVVNAKKEEDIVHPTVKGPGGKPLPVTKRKPRNDAERKIGPSFGRASKNVFRYLALVVLLTYVASAGLLAAHAIWYEDPYEWSKNGLPWAGEWTLVHIVGATFFYLYMLLSLFDWRKGPNVVHLLVWILASIGEIIMALTTLITASNCHSQNALQAKIKDGGDDQDDQICVDSWVKVDMVVYLVRLLHLAAMIAVFGIAWAQKARQRNHSSMSRAEAAESTPLLNGTRRSYDTQNGGADAPVRRFRGRTISNAAKSAGSAAAATRREEGAAFYRPKKLPHKSWWEYMRGYSLFFPYLWPKESRKLQCHVLACFLIALLQRLVNVMVPYQIGVVVNQLEMAVKEVKSGNQLTLETFPLKAALLLGFLWILQGQSGILGSSRALLWIPVSQHSYRSLTTAAFNHVHSLSLDFHLTKRTGEVLSALNKGSSINQFLEQVTFQVIPMLCDLFLSISVFYYRYGALYAEINLIDTSWYLYMTIKMASTRVDQRRDMTNADREEEAVKNDSISSYETVKYFNAEDFEAQRYRDKVDTFQSAEAKVQLGMVMMNICQTLVFNIGRIVAALICGWQVAIGTRTTGDWFTVVSYLTQLQGPLNFFGSFYRTVQQAMISGERLLELFKIQPSVVDAPNAVPLKECSGSIKWSNVTFAYDRRKPALKNISFECPPGTTTAFVGESGGGKSTMFRHMFRYYDCDEGTIELDGHNVRDLTIDSVRRHIGVVPQDTALFNETIMWNLKYANKDATEEEVFDACRAASIHDRIMNFPDGYDTVVGERGMRLSGGEKQRVAIARTILKNPRIIMLDEATSALDTHTEQEIQDNVWNLGQGRTLLVIAHRLSTITHADQIIVLNAGAIVEKGTHEDLLAAGGRYASMWEKQIRAEKALDEAREAHQRAAKAVRRAKMNGGRVTAEVSNDGYDSTASSANYSANASGLERKRDENDSASSSSPDSCSSSDDESATRVESTHQTGKKD